jgi:hypothetical protein
MNKLYLIILILLALPIVTAVELSNTALISTGLNLTINITTPSLFADVVQVEDSFIYFQGLRASDSATDKITINITEQNKSYFGSDLPYFSTNTKTSKIISSSLTNTVNGSVALEVSNCGSIGRITYLSNSGNMSKTWEPSEYTCTSGAVTLSSILLEPGSNSFGLSFNQAMEDICTSSDNTFAGATGLVGLILTMIFLTVILGALILSSTGLVNLDFNIKEIDWKMLVTGVIVVGITFLLLATMVYLIGERACAAFGA